MTKILNLLTPAQCDALLFAAYDALEHFRKSEGVYRRMGANGPKALSTYRTLKYWDFTGSIKEVFNDTLPENILTQFNEAWFLYFPKDGFLDEYQSIKPLFNCLSIPLKDGGKFTIYENNKPVHHKNQAGRGYLYSLDNKHKVTKTPTDQMYLCFLFSNHIQVIN